MITADKLQLEVEKNWKEKDFQVSVFEDFLRENGDIVTKLITSEDESSRRRVVKSLISRVIEFTREY